ncbi:MAG: zinc-dependent peptidase [Pirellulaceae bacterium]|nr:zinc-dependent peptidase [Pirellulaceae bacterium]
MFSWLLNRRRRHWQAPMNPQWRQWISHHLWHWQVLNSSQQQRLESLVRVFIAEKSFEGCDGLKVSPQMQVVIAAAACLLLIGFEDDYCFDKARTILIYPRPTAQRNLRQASGVINERQWLSGMVQHGGPIILSWRDVLRDCQNGQPGHHVVLHEFAHYIDGLDGAMEGLPPFPTPSLQQQWRAVAEKELSLLRTAVDQNEPTILDPYGMQSLAEFFAVATEAFYCDGHNLAHWHPELYHLLSILYRLETKHWFM